MNLTLEELQREAAATGFLSETLEKALRLLALLDALRSHPFLRPRIALKGGTALNLFVFDLPRLSVDVDVNYIGGVAPADLEDQGTSEVFATVPMGDAGLAHETATGGRVVVWGDEWVTFDSDWVGFADVQLFWTQVFAWARPQEFCALPPS